MSDLFDNLARTLAGPMPRRRVLGLAAGTLTAIVLPGRTAIAAPAAGQRTWRTAGCGKGGGGLSCASQFGPTISECCGPIDPTNPDSNYTCCPPGECWHQGTGRSSVTTCCPPAFRCGTRCCAEGERCIDGECSRCDSEKVCGTECCESSEDCANPTKSLCCPKTWQKCTAGLAGAVKCCPPKDQCCFNKATKSAVCCDKQHPCVDGRCKCLKDEKPCGGKCCPPGQECANGKCCPNGKRCGDKCCANGQYCAATIAYSVPKVCCPTNRILVGSGGRVCCPIGTLANNTDRVCCPPSDPECCGSDELTCLGPTICVRGVCQRVTKPK